MRPTDRRPYSWRADPGVPPFDERRMLVLMDGECALCSATARRIARLDRRDEVRLCTIQSPLGQGLLRHYGLAPDDPDTWLLIHKGRATGSLAAAATLFPLLSRAYAPVALLRLLPSAVQDWLYARVARNRYRLFGKGDLCGLPDPEVRRRLVG